MFIGGWHLFVFDVCSGVITDPLELACMFKEAMLFANHIVVKCKKKHLVWSQNIVANSTFIYRSIYIYIICTLSCCSCYYAAKRQCACYYAAKRHVWFKTCFIFEMDLLPFCISGSDSCIPTHNIYINIYHIQALWNKISYVVMWVQI